MSRPKYDPVKEHEVIGLYPGIKGFVIGFAPNGISESPRVYRPIEPRENFKMLFRGETPYWIPESGWFFCDVHEFRPRQHPDNLANHQLLDGGDKVDFAAMGKIIKGWFDLEYQWEELSSGATVRPGLIKVPDISKWEDYISMPNLDDMDWEAIAKDNETYLNVDKANQLGIQFGFWERLMNIMGVAEAAMALIDEDQQDGVHRFFDKLADLYIDYIKRMCACCRIDSVFMHDDWGHQTGPFFSLAVCREMIVPYMKRVIDTCHELGLVFEHHSCGKAETLLPAMIEQGDDLWFPQPTLNDVDGLLEKYKNEPIALAVVNPVLTSDLSEEEVRNLAREWVNKYKGKRALLTQNIYFPELSDPSKYPIFKDAVYEYSRIAYQDADK